MRYLTQIFLIFFLCLTLGSCGNNSSDPSKPTNEAIDSITFYLDKASDAHLSAKERGDFAMKAYSWTHKLEDSLRPKYYRNIGYKFSKINDQENFRKFNLKALKAANKIDNKEAIATSSFNFGYYYLNNNYKSDSAYYYYNKAQHAYRKIKDTLNIGLSILNMGIVQSSENDYSGAQASFIKSIPYF